MHVRPGRRRFAAVLAAAVASLAAGDAGAQSAQSAAAAQVLFEQAKQLMHEKRYAEACAKFTESNRLDAGIGTMLWLADCYEKNGQSASAWAEFVEAADASEERHDDRRKVARERAAALEPTLARLTVEVPVPSDAPGLEVTRDGAAVGRALWGNPVPVDPGPHTLAAHAPGRKAWQTTVTVEAGGRRALVTVPPLQPEHPVESPAPPALVPRSPPAPELRPSTTETPPSEVPAQAGSEARTWGVVVAGVGSVAMGVGLVFGIVAKTHLDDSNANNHCFADNRCDAYGTIARHQALDAANVSTVTLLAGCAVVGAGIVLYVTAPRPPAPSAPSGIPARAEVRARLELSPVVGPWQGVALRALF